MLDLRASLNAASAAGALRRVSFRPDAANEFMHSSCLRERVESGQVSNEQVSSLVLARIRSFYTHPSEVTEHEIGSRSSRQSIHGRAQGRGPPP